MRNTILLTVLAAFLTVSAMAGDWVPTKEITFIVPSSAGGGSDLNARTIAALAQKHNLSPRSFMIINNGGGSGAVGFTNTFAKKGDPHTLMVLHSGQVMGSYVNDWQVKSENLTYVSVLALDVLFLGVRADSPYKTLEDLVKASQAKPEEVAIGGSQRGNCDHLCFELFNKETKAEAAYVSFNSSGDAMSALLGGHIDAGIFNPIEFMGQIQAGDVRPLVGFAPKRIGGLFKDVPTFTELGYPNVVVTESRAIAGPPDMPPEALRFYADMLKKITETPEWQKDYLEKNYLESYYLGPEETKDFYTKQIVGFKKAFDGVDLKK